MPSLEALNRHHDGLEADTAKGLLGMGYLTGQGTYHAVYPSPLVRRVQLVHTPATLYLRTRADRVAVSLARPIAFEWECKTHNRDTLHDMCLEALPLAQHVQKWRLWRVPCLYVYRDPGRYQDLGFWAHEHPPVRDCYLPPRWERNPPMFNYFLRMFQDAFPGVSILIPRPTGGSDDPYVVVDEKHLPALPHWTAVVRQAEADGGAVTF
jgi:hypothetical protein